MATSPCRLSIFLARDSSLAVVLRRGPSAWAQLALWDRARDSIEPGQWLHGRVYERRCDLSPDGSLFLYFAAKHGAGRTRRGAAGGIGEAWTALSRPPHFTALSLWPNPGCWYGGGVFASERHLLLDVVGGLTPHPAFPLPHRFRVEALPGESAPWEQRLLRDGWRLIERGFDPRTHRKVGRREIWQKPHPQVPVTLCREIEPLDFARLGGPYGDSYWLETADDVIPLPEATWADWDGAERLALVRQGKLFVAPAAEGPPRAEPIYDFTPLRPEPRVAPAGARQW